MSNNRNAPRISIACSANWSVLQNIHFRFSNWPDSSTAIVICCSLDQRLSDSAATGSQIYNVGIGRLLHLCSCACSGFTWCDLMSVRDEEQSYTRHDVSRNPTEFLFLSPPTAESFASCLRSLFLPLLQWSTTGPSHTYSHTNPETHTLLPPAHLRYLHNTNRYRGQRSFPTACENLPRSHVPESLLGLPALVS